MRREVIGLVQKFTRLVNIDAVNLKDLKSLNIRQIFSKALGLDVSGNVIVLGKDELPVQAVHVLVQVQARFQRHRRQSHLQKQIKGDAVLTQ